MGLRHAHFGHAAAVVGEARQVANALGEMGLQGCQSDPAVLTAVHAVARMGPAHITVVPGQAPMVGQGQPLRCLGQPYIDAVTMPAARACQQGLHYRVAGHQCAAHVGKQAGRQMPVGDEAGFCLVGEVVPGMVDGVGAGAPENAHHVQPCMARLQCGPI